MKEEKERDEEKPQGLKLVQLPTLPPGCIVGTMDGDDDDEDGMKEPEQPKTADNMRLPFSEELFPTVFRENLLTAPRNRKVPIMLSMFAPLGAIDCRIRMRYPFDRKRLHACHVQVVFEAPPGTGKACFADVAEQIIGPTLEALDEDQRRTEQEYREKKNARTQNEKIGVVPKTTIRCIPPSTSNTVIVRRSDYYKRILGDYLTFWMFAEELALLSDAGKMGYSNLRTIMRIAYDIGAKFGQDFASDNSYSAITDVQMCAMFCGTPTDVDEVFNTSEIVGGGCSRVILCTLEDQIGAKPARFESFTPEQERDISLMLKLLMKQTYDDGGGLKPVINLDMQWLDADIEAWTRRQCRRVKDMQLKGKSGYRAIDTFRKRASVNAFRCTGLMYHMYHLDNEMHGRELHTETEIRALCRKMYRFMSDFCLNSAVNRWGQQYEEYYHKRALGSKPDTRKPLIEQLTKEFTRAQLCELIEKNNMDTDARRFLSMWKSKGWIEKVGKNVYRKNV